MKIRKGGYGKPDDPRLFKWYDFATDLEIDVVVVHVVRTHDDHKELLVMKRSDKVGALAGQWSVVAGVDDLVVEEDPEGATLEVVLSELEDEIGLFLDSSVAREYVTHFADNEWHQRPGRTWKQKLFSVEYNVQDVQLNEEHTEFLWIPVQVISEYLETGTTQDPALSRVISESPGFNGDGNIGRLIEYLQR